MKLDWKSIGLTALIALGAVWLYKSYIQTASTSLPQI